MTKIQNSFLGVLSKLLSLALAPTLDTTSMDLGRVTCSNPLRGFRQPPFGLVRWPFCNSYSIALPLNLCPRHFFAIILCPNTDCRGECPLEGFSSCLSSHCRDRREVNLTSCPLASPGDFSSSLVLVTWSAALFWTCVPCSLLPYRAICPVEVFSAGCFLWPLWCTFNRFPLPVFGLVPAYPIVGYCMTRLCQLCVHPVVDELLIAMFFYSSPPPFRLPL